MNDKSTICGHVPNLVCDVEADYGKVEIPAWDPPQLEANSRGHVVVDEIEDDRRSHHEQQEQEDAP